MLSLSQLSCVVLAEEGAELWIDRPSVEKTEEDEDEAEEAIEGL